MLFFPATRVEPLVPRPRRRSEIDREDRNKFIGKAEVQRPYSLAPLTMFPACSPVLLVSSVYVWSRSQSFQWFGLWSAAKEHCQKSISLSWLALLQSWEGTGVIWFLSSPPFSVFFSFNKCEFSQNFDLRTTQVDFQLFVNMGFYSSIYILYLWNIFFCRLAAAASRAKRDLRQCWFHVQTR